VGYSPNSNEVNAEAEEFPLLEAVIRERLVKTEQTEKNLSCGVVIYKVWTIVMAP
jgi:hypothetical protein